MSDLETLPDNKEASNREIAGKEAAALLLMVFGEEEAAEILARLEPQEVQSLGETMFGVSNVTEKDINEVLDRFLHKACGRTTVGYRAHNQIQNIIHRALGPDRARSIIQKIAPARAESKLDQLNWMTSDEVAGLAADEHPQVQALLLSNLEPEKAAATLALLPAASHEEIIFRIGNMGSVRSSAITEIDRLLSQYQAKAEQGLSGMSFGPPEAAAIMNNIGKPAEKKIIKALAKRDKKLAAQIEDEMFLFEDLIGLDDKNLGVLIRSVDNADLVPALKGAGDKLSKKVLNCMSSRAAQTIEDELEEMGPISRDDAMKAQKAIVFKARTLADDGIIMIDRGGDDYV